MSRKNKQGKTVLEGAAKFNRISRTANAIFSIIFILAALCCIIPLIFVIIISFTSQSSIYQNGYSFLPSEWSLKAYQALFKNAASVVNAFVISLIVTVVGTGIGLVLNATMGYVLSRRSFRLRKLYTWIVFIPMIFNGGMVGSYMIITRVLRLKDSIWALILPLAVTSFYVIILRTFFTTTVPDSLIESAKIDGAGQLRIFFQIVLPISLPAIATVGLFLSFSYWNDWWNALMYVQNTQRLWPLQYMLISLERRLEVLANNPAMQGLASVDILKELPEDGVRMALVVITVIPIACSYPFFQKYFVSGLTVGAVKG